MAQIDMKEKRNKQNKIQLKKPKKNNLFVEPDS